MLYAEARPLIRSGDVVAFSHGDWRTWSGIKVNIVRMFTRSTFSHTGLAWVVGGRVLVLEAVKPKLRIYPLSLLGDFYLVPTGAPWREPTEAYALDRVGVNYSELVALRAFFEPLEAGNVQQCAAYVREVLLRDGIDLGQRATPDAVVDAALKRSGQIDFVSNPPEAR